MKLKNNIIVKIIIQLFIIVNFIKFNTIYAYGEETLNQYDYENAQATSGLNDSAHEIISYAYKFMGKPYVFGASGPNSFDCSGFTSYVFKHCGMSIPRTSGEQFNVGTAVSRTELKAGDLIFFNTYTNIGHVGIYIGSGDFIHAAASGSVKINSLDDNYYSTHYAGARRVV